MCVGIGLACTLASLGILLGLTIVLYHPDKQRLYNFFEVTLAVVQVLGHIPVLHTIIIKQTVHGQRRGERQDSPVSSPTLDRVDSPGKLNFSEPESPPGKKQGYTYLTDST